ncbi:MAG: type II secretion system protein [Sulfuriflexus sp.]|nr:type II secretion system protein [Sulfuriflexus sp.]
MMMFSRQKGFTLVAAIFLLIILASLGAYMVTIGGTARATSTAALQGARAYQAARAGINWSVFFINGIPKDTARDNCDDIIEANSFTLNVAGFNNFTVSTSCKYTTHDQQGTDNITVYTIMSTATTGGSYGDPDFIQRRITATISPPSP